MRIVIIPTRGFIVICTAIVQNPPEKKKPNEEAKTYDKSKMWISPKIPCFGRGFFVSKQRNFAE
jgi:hypothetical protein